MRHDPQRERSASLPELLLDQLGLGVAVIDEAGRSLYVSSACARLGVLPDGVGVGARIERHERSWEISHVPLVVSGRPTSGRFSAPEVYVVRTIANVLGAAIARDAAHVETRMLALHSGRLAREALESGERERQRLADVLHDDVLQHLLFARQECAALASSETDPALARLRQSLDDATRLLRDAVSEIHPVTLAHVGLGPTVQTLAQEYAGRGGFDVTVRVTYDGPTPHDQLVVTAVRELLNNVVKHAQASAVEVNVHAAETGLVVEVSDDGAGFDQEALCEAVAGGHVGLASLIERVEALGGRAELRATAGGRGACVRLTLPAP